MRSIGAVLAVAVLASASLAADKPDKTRVSFEIVTEEGLPVTGTQQWYQAFTAAGVTSLRIRAATGTDTVGVEKRGTKQAPHYDVLGLVKADGTLILPGAKFTSRDTAKLKRWVEELADLGVEGVTQGRSAFGLTPSQILDVNEDLKKAVSFSTEGLTVSDALAKLGGRLTHRFEIDAAAGKALSGVKIEEQLQGLSCGTAVAVMLRPAGLVLTPERPEGGELRFRVSRPVEGRESWPIGWKSELPDVKVVPKLFEMINVEIDETPISDALSALEGRLQIPFLWDHNALAHFGIDPAKIEAKLPSKKLSYSLILQRVLSQAKLKKELRVDEAGKPFLWITSVKPM